MLMTDVHRRRSGCSVHSINIVAMLSQYNIMKLQACMLIQGLKKKGFTTLYRVSALKPIKFDPVSVCKRSYSVTLVQYR